MIDPVTQDVDNNIENAFTGGRSMKRRTMKKRRTLIKKRITKTGIKGRGAFIKGWAKQSPGTRERTLMLKRCGKKCFLGPNKSFPICKRGTCKRSRKGVYSAFIRAREYAAIKNTKKYSSIARTAKKLLQK
jgi:hypothetical protein